MSGSLESINAPAAKRAPQTDAQAAEGAPRTDAQAAEGAPRTDAPAAEGAPRTDAPAAPRPAPDWRIAVAIVTFVVAIALAGYFIAITRLSGGNPVPATPVASAGGLVTISEWPTGLAGWTVVLSRTRSEAVAYAKATNLAREGLPAGVIDSSQHPGLTPGYWVTFSGRYLSKRAAISAARQLADAGHHGARARLIERA